MLFCWGFFPLLNSTNLVAHLHVIFLISLKSNFEIILSYLEGTPLLYYSSVLSATVCTIFILEIQEW